MTASVSASKQAHLPGLPTTRIYVASADDVDVDDENTSNKDDVDVDVDTVPPTSSSSSSPLPVVAATLSTKMTSDLKALLPTQKMRFMKVSFGSRARGGARQQNIISVRVVLFIHYLFIQPDFAMVSCLISWFNNNFHLFNIPPPSHYFHFSPSLSHMNIHIVSGVIFVLLLAHNSNTIMYGEMLLLIMNVTWLTERLLIVCFIIISVG
jgi:hypothetical protein